MSLPFEVSPGRPGLCVLLARKGWIWLGPIFIFAGMAMGQTTEKVDPFKNSDRPVPANYKGPIFHLSHDYPTARPDPPVDPPWIKALGGKPISQDNALAYVKALKDYIAADMRKLILDYANWNADQAGWYNMPWLFSITEPIHGTYVGSSFPHTMFPLSGLKKDMTTLVVVYYDRTAGYTIGQIWGKDAMKPDLSRAQYQEGAIIVKVALTTATKEEWAPMEGAATWDIGDGGPNPSKAAFFQFDIIVKDSKTAPRTTWVFSTLVYDKNARGDAWDKMIPLGAMWGNDPDVNSAINPNVPLKENVINPMAPLYATETLGYGGRLSGPNDGAIVQDAIIDGDLVPRVTVSSCMSCHGVAENPMRSFLLPGPGISNAQGGISPTAQGDLMYLDKPGSVAFLQWFQDRPGTEPQDSGTQPLDYHMNLAFKALPLWAKFTGQDPGQIYARSPAGLRELLLHPESSSKTGRLLDRTH